MMIVDVFFSCLIYFICYSTFDGLLMELDNRNGIRRKWGTRHVMVIFWFITWPTIIIKEKYFDRRA